MQQVRETTWARRACSLKRRKGAVASIAAATVLFAALVAPAAGESVLPRIAAAPQFSLTDQNGAAVSLGALRGRVAVVTFLFTSCSDTCPLLTTKLVAIQKKLGANQDRVQFVGITVDPLTDTPAVLKRYAQAHSADPLRFSFLTGSFDQIAEVARRYAVFHRKQANGSVDHSFLTSLVDASGTLRVQYSGWRFSADEFLADLRSLLQEKAAR